MPSKKKKYNSRFPPARIKKIMQTDEEVGKVAQVVPIIISKALEIFVASLLRSSSDITRNRNARTLTPNHIKTSILSNDEFQFLRDLAQTIPDVNPTGDEEDEGSVTPGTQMVAPRLQRRTSQNKTSTSTTSSTATATTTIRARGRPRKRPLESQISLSSLKEEHEEEEEEEEDEDTEVDEEEDEDSPQVVSNTSDPLINSNIESRNDINSNNSSVSVNNPMFYSESLSNHSSVLIGCTSTSNTTLAKLKHIGDEDDDYDN